MRLLSASCTNHTAADLRVEVYEDHLTYKRQYCQDNNSYHDYNHGVLYESLTA